MMIGKFILILGDDADVVANVGGSLRKQGLVVHAFTNPIAAMEDFTQNFKDCVLVISDIRMPQMNGFQFARRAWELKPDVKVIFMTAFEISIPEFEKIHPSMKVYGLIKKPILMRKLETLIKNSMTATVTVRENERVESWEKPDTP